MKSESKFSINTKHLRTAPEYKTLSESIRLHSLGKEVHFVSSPGNYGDGLINVGSRQFFEHYGIQVVEHSRKEILRVLEDSPEKFDDLLVIIGGGGGWSKNFSSTRAFTEKVAEACRMVIVLPTTYELPPAESQNIVYYARDNRTSIQVVPTAIFCHDMAFFIDLEIPSSDSKLWRLYAFRGDREGYQYHRYFERNIDVSLLGGGSYKDALPFFSIINNFKQIYTDRLHVAIASSMLGRDVSFTGGNYPKNYDVFESTIAPSYPKTRFLEFDDILRRLFPSQSATESRRQMDEKLSKKVAQSQLEPVATSIPSEIANIGQE